MAENSKPLSQRGWATWLGIAASAAAVLSLGGFTLKDLLRSEPTATASTATPKLAPTRSALVDPSSTTTTTSSGSSTAITSALRRGRIGTPHDQTVSIFAGPSHAEVVGTIPGESIIGIECQTTGEEIVTSDGRSSTWVKIARGFIPDLWVVHDPPGDVVPNCS